MGTPKRNSETPLAAADLLLKPSVTRGELMCLRQTPTCSFIIDRHRIDAIADATQRLHRLEQQPVVIVLSRSTAQVVAVYQAMRGASFLVTATFAAETGGVCRFDTPPQLYQIRESLINRRLPSHLLPWAAS
jgi:hypothetical protein